MPTQADLHRLFDYSKHDNTLIFKHNKKKPNAWNERNAGQKIKPLYENGKRYLMVMNALYLVDDLIDVWLGVSYDLKSQTSDDWYKNYSRKIKAIHSMNSNEIKEFQRQTIKGEYTLLNQKIEEIKIKENPPYYHIKMNSRNNYSVEVYSGGKHYFTYCPSQEEAIDFVNRHIKKGF